MTPLAVGHTVAASFGFLSYHYPITIILSTLGSGSHNRCYRWMDIFRHNRTLILIPCFVLLLGWQNVSGQTTPLFDSDEVLPLVLRGELKNAFRDRKDNSAYYHASISYLEGPDSLIFP